MKEFIIIFTYIFTLFIIAAFIVYINLSTIQKESLKVTLFDTSTNIKENK